MFSNTQRNHRVLLTGYYGAGNIGDETILYFTIKELEGLCDITVLDLNPKLRTFGNKAKYIKLPKLSQLKDMIILAKNMIRSDILILGGGGYIANKLEPFQINLWLSMILISKILRKKVIIFGAGCGPFRKDLLSLPAKIILNNVDKVIVRDKSSEHHLRGIGVKLPIEVSADLAFLLEKKILLENTEDVDKIFQKSNKPIVLFVLPLRFHLKKIWRENEFRNKYYRYVHSFAEIANHIIEKLNGTPIFLPFDPNDKQLYEEIIEFIGNKEKAILYDNINYNNPDFQRLLYIFENVDIVFCGRYHSFIYSIIAETPSLPIIYSPKFSDLVSEFGLNESALEVGDGKEWDGVDLDIQKGIDLMTEVLHNKDHYGSKVSVRKAYMRQRVMNSVVNLKKELSEIK